MIVMALRHKNKLTKATEKIRDDEKFVRAEYQQAGIKMDNPDFVTPTGDDDREGEAESEGGESEGEESPKPPPKKKKKKKKKNRIESDSEGSTP
jgi:hypothetical protein